jgi:hypothetical protein
MPVPTEAARGIRAAVQMAAAGSRGPDQQAAVLTGEAVVLRPTLRAGPAVAGAARSLVMCPQGAMPTASV